MRKILFNLLIIFSFAFTVSAQTKDARKIDEFESYRCEEMLYFLDKFAIELSKETNSTGFIIVYEGKYSKFTPDKEGGELKTFLPQFGESILRTREMQNFWLARNFKEKVLFINGGFREKHKVELWIVPNGSTLPKLTPNRKVMKYQKGEPGVLCQI